MIYNQTKPLIFGINGTRLSDQEREFFASEKPYGFILFKRNIESGQQLIWLTSEIKSLFPDRFVEIFVDQEGGRVSRIKPPIALREYPSARSLASKGIADIEASYQDLMLELVSFGITATCAPVADLLFPGANDVIGNRSFGSNPHEVVKCCAAALRGIQKATGRGVIKHIPGHGRAKLDSHYDLPVIENSIEELRESDFLVFKELASSSIYAMTAHIIYNALDSSLPATLSKSVVSYIRKEIGFHGILITDDLSMKALKGDLGDLAKQALSAGCDLILHCNGNLDEMKNIANAVT